MKSYRKQYMRPTQLAINTATEGESIENKLERIINNKEPIKDGAPMIYTPRQEGVRPSTNIRTDRFDVALEATEKIQKSYKARREERMKAPNEDGGAKPIVSDPKGTPGTGETNS